MKNNTLPCAVFGFGPVVSGLVATMLAPTLTGVASAQSTATIATTNQFTYPDNEGIVQIQEPGDPSSATLNDFYLGGQLTKVVPAGSNTQLPAGQFVTYCVDAFSDLANPETVTVQQLNSSFALGEGASGVNVGGAIAWIYNNDVPPPGDFTEPAAEFSAATQLAIWEVEYDWTGTGLGGIDTSLMTGNVIYVGNPASFPPDLVNYNTTVTAAIRADAANILNGWDGQVSTGTLLSTSVGGGQSLVGPPVSFASAPEPNSVAFLIGPALGLLVGSVVRRRLRKA